MGCRAVVEVTLIRGEIPGWMYADNGLFISGNDYAWSSYGVVYGPGSRYDKTGQVCLSNYGYGTVAVNGAGHGCFEYGFSWGRGVGVGVEFAP